MSENNPLNNISPKVFPMPETHGALGQLIGELASEDPRAIIIDFFQAVIVMHPSGVGGKPKLTEDSIPYLLTNFQIEMQSEEYDLSVIEETVKQKFPGCTLALNPEYKTTSFTTEVIWSPIINQIALVIQQKTSQSDWRIYGLQITQK
jgi:hypothetical protein